MLTKLKILIVEDDEDIIYLLSDFLQNHCNFSVKTVSTVTEGVSYIRNEKFDILLLDLNLPDFSGFDMLIDMKNNVTIPSIAISAYNDLDTKLKAFKLGVSDYMVKPIELLELEARIWAVLGKKDNSKFQIQCNDILFKIEENNIYFKNEKLVLTSLEYDILSFFIQYKDQVISREQLAQSITSVNSHRLLDNHIKNIRNKIEEDKSKPKYLKTEYGIGYRFNIKYVS